MTTPAKTTTYTQCEQCGFWHASDESHCANCGVSLVKEYETVVDEVLTEKNREKNSNDSSGLGCGLGLIVGFIAAITWNLMGYDDDIAPIIFGCGVVFCWFVVGVSAYFRTPQKMKCVLKPPKVVAKGLRQNEELIKQRLDEIGQKKQKIQGVIEELKQIGDPQRNRVRFQTLDKGAAELSRQRDRYAEKLREIELIRWSNQLSPLLSHSPHLTEQQAQERLEMLGKIQTQGRRLAQTWQQTPLADEETRCAERLGQALSTCDQLRQDLLDLKTALAVGDISAFNKEEQRASQTALELLDTFNALPDVGGFTAGFKKLEDEYFRLQSEDEVRQLTK